MILGTWSTSDVPSLTFRPDYSLHEERSEGVLDGLWRVDHGTVIMTIKSWNERTNLDLVISYKVIKIDDTNLAVYATNQFVPNFPVEFRRRMPNN